MSQVAEPPRGVHLATEPDFRLGSLEVSPSACRLRADGREQRVQPRVMEVLVVLVRAAGRTVSRDDLVEACWGGRFVSDDAISRAIAEVRNLARAIEPAPFTLETVPKVGYRLVRRDAAAGADVAQAEPGAAPARPEAGGGRRRRGLLLVAGLAVLLCGAGGLALWRLGGGASPPSWQNGRVQVMRFEALRQDPPLRPLSLALGEGVARMLAVTGVETTGATAARDADDDASGAEIRVAGSVDHDGDRVVINAQALDRRTGLVLWSGRFDRPADALTGFQEEAAARIADTLQCAIKRRAYSRQAMASHVFALVLKACAVRRFDAPGFAEITSRLVKAAPRLSAAHSFHATAQAFLANQRDTSPPDVAALREAARRSARRALELDPQNAEAYFALAVSHRSGEDWLVRERHFRRAMELKSDHLFVSNLYVELLRDVGRIEEARQVNGGSMAADPLSPAQPGRLAMLWASAGDLPRAEELLRQAELLAPEQARQTRLTVAFWWDEPSVARQRLRAAGSSEPPRILDCFDTYLARLERASGKALSGLPATCDALAPDWRVRMLARQGDIDGAYAELARPLPLSRGHTIFLFYPEMKAFRADPRFMPLAHRLGLVDYWRTSGRWPDFCVEPDLPYDCRAVARSLSKARPAPA